MPDQPPRYAYVPGADQEGSVPAEQQLLASPGAPKGATTSAYPKTRTAGDGSPESPGANEARGTRFEVRSDLTVCTLRAARAYPIDGDQFGDVEYSLDKAGWRQQGIAAGGCPPG